MNCQIFKKKSWLIQSSVMNLVIEYPVPELFIRIVFSDFAC